MAEAVNAAWLCGPCLTGRHDECIPSGPPPNTPGAERVVCVCDDWVDWANRRAGMPLGTPEEEVDSIFEYIESRTVNPPKTKDAEAGVSRPPLERSAGAQNPRLRDGRERRRAESWVTTFVLEAKESLDPVQ